MTGSCQTFFEGVKGWLSKLNRTNFNQIDIIMDFRLHPSKVKRHISELKENCYVSVASGDSYKSGYMYTITDYSDNDMLKSRVSNALSNSLDNMSHRNQLSLSGSGVAHA